MADPIFPLAPKTATVCFACIRLFLMKIHAQTLCLSFVLFPVTLFTSLFHLPFELPAKMLVNKQLTAFFYF
jgi:hypothetical protein